MFFTTMLSKYDAVEFGSKTRDLTHTKKQYFFKKFRKEERPVKSQIPGSEAKMSSIHQINLWIMGFNLNFIEFHHEGSYFIVI